jgi:hypothetical protein
MKVKVWATHKSYEIRLGSEVLATGLMDKAAVDAALAKLNEDREDKYEITGHLCDARIRRVRRAPVAVDLT